MSIERRDAPPPLSRSAALSVLARSKPDLASRFGVKELALFGSVSRDNASLNSDVDILVSFDGQISSARFFGVQFYLEDCLGRAVDLVTDNALRTELRSTIEREAVRV
jgi:uncharacterized protein